MTLNLFLCLVALGASIAMLTRVHQKPVALTAVVATGVLVLMQLGIVYVKMNEIRLLAWALICGIGVYLFLKTQERTSAALSSAMIFASSIPLGRLTGLIR